MIIILKFEDKVVPGGMIIVDSSVVPRKVNRTDVKAFYVDATSLSEENGLKGCASIILIGKLFKEDKFCSEEALFKAIDKCVPPKKAAMLETNKNALKLGMEK